MIAVDTNILVYAHRADLRFHNRARACVTELAEGTERWAIPWPCIHEFIAVVTNPRVFKTPTPTEAVVAQVEAWMRSPKLVLLAEEDGYWPVARSLIQAAAIQGARVHDARIAALARFHGVTELFTADRDFSRFPSLEVRNPL
ncbi:MAG: PIN domain-containing protein [Deltaproteobacteria bacterium]|nr:PIN domain-containing protein [Deltaproteobacteria bacterium]